MARGKGIFTRETSDGGRKCQIPYIPARFVFAGVLFLGAFVNVLLLASLPISITVMVRRNTSNAPSGVETDTCPGAPVQQNSSNITWTVTGEYDWDEVMQSTVLTASTYGELASTMIGGRLTELWNTKYMCAIFYSISAAIYMLLPVTADWSVVAIIVFQVIGGLFAGPLQPLMMTLIATWFPAKERQPLYGMLMSVVSVGTIVASVMTGNLVSSMGWRFVFYLFASLVLAWTLLWMFLAYESPNKHPRISEEERLYITNNTKKDESQAAHRLPYKEILLSPPVWAHIAMTIPGAWVSGTLGNALPTYLRNIQHYEVSMIGNISAVNSFASWMSIMFFGFFSQWLRNRQYVSKLVSYHIFNFIATLMPAVLLVCIPSVPCNSTAVITMLLLVGVLTSAYIGGSQLNPMDLAINYTGTLSGISITISSVIKIVAPMITGVLTNNRQTLTAWNTVFYIAAGVKIIPFFIFLFFGSVEEQPWNRIEQEEQDKTLAVDPEVQRENTGV